MELIETEDGYIPIDRIVLVLNHDTGHVLIRYFDGYAVLDTLAKGKWGKSGGRTLLSVPGAELLVISRHKASKK